MVKQDAVREGQRVADISKQVIVAYIDIDGMEPGDKIRGAWNFAPKKFFDSIQAIKCKHIKRVILNPKKVKRGIPSPS